MTTIWFAFLLALATAIVATRSVMNVALRFGILDRPDGYRKLHSQATPYAGGVAVFIAFFVPLLALVNFPHLSTISGVVLIHGTKLIGLLVCATLALTLGLMDDKFDLPAVWKLLWQILIATVAFSFGFSIKAVSNPFGDPLTFGIFAYPVTVFWFVGCMNAVNLLDGLDGLAAGVCLFVSLILLLVSLYFNNLPGMFLMACMGGAVLGFLFYNFPPARIFLGDSGSMLLGALIAALSLVGASQKAETAVALFIPIIALGLPIFDTSMAIARRWYKRLPIGEPDRRHIHHVLVAMGYSQQRVVLTLYAMSVALGGAALLITFVGRSEVVLLVIGSLIVTAFVSIRIFSGVRFTDVIEKLSQDKIRLRHARETRQVLDRAVGAMRTAGNLDVLWAVCAAAAGELGFSFAELSLAGDAGSRTWRSRGEVGADGSASHRDAWSVALALVQESESLGELVLRKEVASIADDIELAKMLDRLRTEMAERIVEMTATGSRSPSPGACPDEA